MIITSKKQPRFQKEIIKDYYLENEKQTAVSLLRTKSLESIKKGEIKNLLMCIDNSYYFAHLQYKKVMNDDHLMFYFIDDKNKLLAHASVYIPEEYQNIAILNKIFVRDENELTDIIYGKYTPLQCIYFKMIEYIKEILNNQKELLFNASFMTDQILLVLKQENISYCFPSELDSKIREKDFNNYEWSNTNKQRKRKNK